jgi:N-acetyl-anhydromuramyl-L-alanine amidase AmpD
VIIDSWDKVDAGVSVHAFIQDNAVIQTLPWDYKAWHIGKGSKGSWNGCSIGVEICEPSGHKYNGGTMIGYDVKKNATYFTAVYNNAVELFAYLCQEYKLDPMQDIYCHCEVNKLGYGSNHADVMQWFPKHGKSMDTFRADVKAKITEINKTEKQTMYRVQVGAFSVKENADRLAEELKKKGYKDAMVI